MSFCFTFTIPRSSFSSKRTITCYFFYTLLFGTSLDNHFPSSPQRSFGRTDQVFTAPVSTLVSCSLLSPEPLHGPRTFGLPKFMYNHYKSLPSTKILLKSSRINIVYICYDILRIFTPFWSFRSIHFVVLIVYLLSFSFLTVCLLIFCVSFLIYVDLNTMRVKPLILLSFKPKELRKFPLFYDPLLYLMTQKIFLKLQFLKRDLGTN